MKKNNLTLIISLIVMLILGIICLIVGYAISGANILDWLQSKWAITIYIAMGLYGIIVAIILINERIKKL